MQVSYTPHISDRPHVQAGVDRRHPGREGPDRAEQLLVRRPHRPRARRRIQAQLRPARRRGVLREQLRIPHAQLRWAAQYCAVKKRNPDRAVNKK